MARPLLLAHIAVRLPETALLDLLQVAEARHMPWCMAVEHMEAVALRGAVAAVLAEIAAWRVAEGDGATIRGTDR